MKDFAPIVCLILLLAPSLLADTLAERRGDALAPYVDRLAAGATHDALRAAALSDLSFADLKIVIVAYSAAKDLHDPYGFQELLLRNSAQYILPRELLELYAPDYLKWLREDARDRATLFAVLATSQMDRRAADLAVRLTPDESLAFIRDETLRPFRKALLAAWCRRWTTYEENRPLDSALLADVLSLSDDSAAFLLFKGYWPQALDSLRIDLIRLLSGDVRQEVMMALHVQESHPLACEQNKAVIRKWQDDAEIVIQALKNFGEDSEHDHSRPLAELWQMLPADGKQRYWCLYSIAVHPQGNEGIALKAIETDGYDSLDLTLAALRNSPGGLAKGIRLMLTTHKKGYSELFRFAATYRIP
ncbi:MAG: hypothetical protein ACI8W8_004787, partial [Rhodothermales bacterium]